MAYSSSTVHIDIVDITYHLMQTINNEMKILVGVFFVFFLQRKMQIFVLLHKCSSLVISHFDPGDV